MDRRSFLLGSSALTLSQLLAGCGGQNQPRLEVQVLKGSIPAQAVSEFRKSLAQPAQLQFNPVEQLRVIFQQLQAWQNKTTATNKAQWRLPLPLVKSEAETAADLVTLGDYWLEAAIQNKLIQPLEPAQLEQWSALPERWQKLVTRNDQGKLDEQGKVWAAPYRWGTTVIVYNRKKFQELNWTPTDWSDLWREELRDRISVLDQPREVVGLTLKKLGKSYNTENLNTVTNLEKELRALDQQVKLYSSDTYLQPLIIGDTWLAVGWSSEVLPILQRYPQLAAVIPKSGTAIWADLWVRPAGQATDNISQKWIDFCWLPTIAKQISLLTKGTSPIPTNLVGADFQAQLSSILLTDPEVFAKSEFLLSLSPSVTKEYESLFAKIRS